MTDPMPACLHACMPACLHALHAHLLTKPSALLQSGNSSRRMDAEPKDTKGLDGKQVSEDE